MQYIIIDCTESWVNFVHYGGDRRHFSKKTANAISWHEQKKTILSHATSVGNKQKQIEDRKTFLVSNIVSIVSSSSNKADQKEVHENKDLLECSMASVYSF